jgi:type IV secretory pathway TrbL component
MWLGEQITARGIGNGISLIIMAGIVANVPSALASLFEIGRNGALSPLMMRISNLLVAAISAVIYAVLAWVTYQVAVRNTAVGSFVVSNQMRVPTWPAYWLPPVGFGLAALVAALRVPALLLPERLTGARS